MPTGYEVDQYINHIRSASLDERKDFARAASNKLANAFARQGGDPTKMLYTLAIFYILQDGKEGLTNAAYDFFKYAYESQLSKEDFLDKVNDNWGEEEYDSLMRYMRHFDVDEMDAFVELAACLYASDGEFGKKERATIRGFFGVDA